MDAVNGIENIRSRLHKTGQTLLRNEKNGLKSTLTKLRLKKVNSYNG